MFARGAFVARCWMPFTTQEWLSADRVLATLAAPMRVDCTVTRGGTWSHQPIDEPGLAVPMVKHALARGAGVCVFALDAEHAFAPELARLLAALENAPRRPCRLGLSVSTARSTIPLHADDADVMIVQVEGRRRWRVFPEREGSQRAELILRRSGRFVDERCLADPPEVDVELAPGDVLVIPAFMPHKADANNDRLCTSASLIWPVVTPAGLATASGLPVGETPGWFHVLPEPAPGGDPLAHYRRLVDASIPAAPVEVRVRLAAQAITAPWLARVDSPLARATRT